MASSAGVRASGDAEPVIPSSGPPGGYRFLLPALPSSEGMKACVVLHCDLEGRPYRIEDFRSPLEELDVIKAVSGIGPFQMSHVWLVKLRTQQAKETLVRSGSLRVKGRYCAVIDPARQDVTVKLHWVPFDDPNEPLARILSEFGEVKEIRREEWRVPGFSLPDSTTRTVRMTLREGVVPDSLPELIRYGDGVVLCVVPGRAPTCLRCGMRGHIRRDCATPQCAKCRGFGHMRQDCVRTYANVTGNRRVNEVAQDLMDQDEAERAATAAPVSTINTGSGGDGDGGQAPVVTNNEPAPKMDAPAETAQQTDGEAGKKEQERTAQVEEGHKESEEDAIQAASEDGEEEESSKPAAMDVTQGSGKRPHDAGDDAEAAQRLRRLETAWKEVTGRKKKDFRASQRSTSLPCERKTGDGGGDCE